MEVDLATIDAVFLDRDGVICAHRSDHVKNWDEFSLIAGASAAIRRLNGLGIRVFVITNQPGIAKGIFTREQANEVNDRMVDQLAQDGAEVSMVYICPHQESDACDCRKPAPGMLQDAEKEYGIDLGRSVVIGDTVRDLGAAAAVGAASILVRTGKGETEVALLPGLGLEPIYVAHDLTDAVGHLLGGIG